MINVPLTEASIQNLNLIGEQSGRTAKVSEQEVAYTKEHSKMIKSIRPDTFRSAFLNTNQDDFREGVQPNPTSRELTEAVKRLNLEELPIVTSSKEFTK